MTAEIFKSIVQGNLHAIQDYVTNHIDLNVINENGNSTLAIATAWRHMHIFKYLLDHVDINKFGPRKGRPGVMWAVHNKSIQFLKLYLERKPELNIVDYYNETPLLVAIRSDRDDEFIDMLLEGGADINYDGTKTPLTCAVEENKMLIVKKLVELGADVNKRGKVGLSPLLTAITKGNLEMIKYLVDKGADVSAAYLVDVQTCLSLNGISNRDDIIEYLRDCHLKTKTALFYEAQHGCLRTVQHLVSTGCPLDNTDSNGNTVLTIAIKNSQEAVAKLLVKSGADVCKYVSPGQSPLCAAVEARALAMVPLLLDHGAHLSVQSAFRKAIEARSLELVELFKEKGAQLNMKYSDGYSPLTVAANVEHLPVIKFLIEKGANVNEVDGNGRCALAIAAGKCSFQTVKFLIDSGGDVKLAEKELRRFAELNEDFKSILKSLQSWTALAKVTDESGNEQCDE